VSGQNVEIVRASFEAFERGDLERALAAADPDLVSTRVDPDGSVFHGRAGFVQMVAEWTEEFDDWSFSAGEYIDAGERVVMRMHQAGRRAASGARVDADFWVVYCLSAGAITALDIYSERRDALEAAGLPPT
jgi:ketosteroid isomerase-like protein